jgi:putative copper resistance protein D
LNWGRVLFAWPVLATQLIIFGTAAFALSLGSDAAARRDRLIAGLRVIWRVLGLISLALSPFLFIEIVAGMAGTTWSQALSYSCEVLRETHAGHVWEWRFPLVILLATAGWLPLHRATSAILLFAISGSLLFCESLTSHAIDYGAAAVALFLVHELSGGLWIGAVFSLWFGARRVQLSADWIDLTAPWVSRLAGWTVIVLLLSGGYTAYQTLMGDVSLLLHSAYGRNLLIKIGAASIVLLIGAYNRFILIPELAGFAARNALLKNVLLESILLIGVVGLAALLANTPPAHHSNHLMNSTRNTKRYESSI